MSRVSHVNVIAMIKKSVIFSLISIGLVYYFNFYSSISISKSQNKSSDSIFVSQTIGVKEKQNPAAVISSEQLLPIIKKYRFLITPY